MSWRGGGAISRIYSSFKKAFKSEKPGTLVGVDQLGHKYYEGHTDKNGKKSRWVEGKDPDDIMSNPKVPTEWLTWLQHRRKDPPTEQEVLKRQVYTARTLQRAHDLEKARESEDKGRDKEIEKETSKKEEMAGKFPVYEEYEHDPFTKYGKKDDDS